MAGWKYVMLQFGETSIPIIFPEHLTHADISRMGRRIVRDSDLITKETRNNDVEVVSAGFIGHVEIDGCYGRSESLSTMLQREVAAHRDDAFVINNYTVHSGHGARSDKLDEPMDGKEARRIKAYQELPPFLKDVVRRLTIQMYRRVEVEAMVPLSLRKGLIDRLIDAGLIFQKVDLYGSKFKLPEETKG